MARDGPVDVVSLTTLDPESRARSSRAPPPRTGAARRSRRWPAGFAGRRQPRASDPVPERPRARGLLAAAAGAGRVSACLILVRLPWEVNPLVEGWLAEHSRTARPASSR